MHSHALSVVLSFKTQLPFDRLPVWRELRVLPLAEQKPRLHDPELRRRLVEAARERDRGRAIGTEARPAVYEWIFVMDTVEGPHRSVAEVARERCCDPVEAMIDLALEKDFELFFLQPIANEDQDTALEQAVRMLSLVPATYWGFVDRGLIREGMAADLIVFDPETIGPEMPEVVHDLPADAQRLIQRARGFAATVVNGEIVLRDGRHTGALPGQLLRGPLARGT